MVGIPQLAMQPATDLRSDPFSAKTTGRTPSKTKEAP